MKLSPRSIGTAVSAGVLALALTAAAIPAAAVPDAVHAWSRDGIPITHFGATPNDDSDDLAAIEQTIAAAALLDVPVFIPRGTFLYSDLIHLDGVDLRGTGPRSILHATNAEHQALVITGDGVELMDVKLTTIPVTHRLTTPESARVLIEEEAVGYRVEGIEIDGASSGGILNFGSDGLIRDNLVRNTLADGIHLTGRSSGVRVLDNRVIDTGDDQIAVVSYDNPEQIVVTGIEIRGNRVSGGHARGITVSGGSDIRIHENHISNTGGAGIFIASEGGWRTLSVTGLRVTKNTIVADSQNPAIPEKGGIRLQATYLDPSISDAVFEKNTITDSGDSGILIVGTTGIEATFSKNVITRPAAYGIRIVSTVVGSLTFSKNKVRSAGAAPFSNASEANVVTDLENDPDAGDGGTGEEHIAANGTPMIDGVVEALWAGSSELRLNVEPNGTTGTARVAWDETALYFLFEMVDSTPNAAGVNEGNDSVEVWVDELHAATGVRGPGDYQIRVDLAGTITSGIESFPLETVTAVVVQYTGGYTVEFAVPYTALDPVAGSVIGFNASANDDSNGDGIRDNYLSWVDKNLPYWADTRVYGDVKLVG